MNEKVKNGLTADEINLLSQGLKALRAQWKRAADSEVDTDVRSIRVKAIARIDDLTTKLFNKELF